MKDFAAKKRIAGMWYVIILQPYTVLPAGVTSAHLKPREINQFVTQLAGKPRPLKKHRLAITTQNGTNQEVR